MRPATRWRKRNVNVAYASPSRSSIGEPLLEALIGPTPSQIRPGYYFRRDGRENACGDAVRGKDCVRLVDSRDRSANQQSQVRKRS